MSSPVSICNQALSWLGGNQIVDLDGPQTESRLCKTNYAPLRQSLLETGNFSFAVKRIVLGTMLADSPEWGYSNAFLLPSDCISVLGAYRSTATSGHNLGDYSVDWEQFGREIHTDEAVVYLEYAADVEATNKYTPLFEQAFAARIAADICMPLTKSRTLSRDMWSLYEQKMSEASGYNNRLKSRSFRKTAGLLSARGRVSIAGAR